VSKYLSAELYPRDSFKNCSRVQLFISSSVRSYRRLAV